MRYQIPVIILGCVAGCASAPAQKYPVETLADQLRLNAFKYIANDAAAQQFFGLPGPLKITVFGHVRCFPFAFKKVPVYPFCTNVPVYPFCANDIC